MPPTVPPVPPDLPRYTRWSDVPEDLLTRTQLGQLEPPRKPGGLAVAQVLYHGNKYAPLYPLAEAVEKRRTTPAQRAALARALELQYVCRRCEQRHDEPLGKGRWCDGCRRAMVLWQLHDQAQVLARDLVADPAAALLVVDVAPDRLPVHQQVAVLDVREQRVLYCAQAGEAGSAEREAVVERLDALLAGRRVVIEPNYMWPARWPHHLLGESERCYGVHPVHRWATWHVREHPSMATLWSEWFAWTDYPSSHIPVSPNHHPGGPWGPSADVTADGLAMVQLLQRIAEGTEPVAQIAPWVLDGIGIPAVPAGVLAEVSR